MREHDINKLDNFMCAWYADDDAMFVCDELINFHKNSTNKRPGTTGGGLLPEVKKSTDVLLEDYEMIKLYHQNILDKCFDAYVEKYEWAGRSAFSMAQFANVQHYKPGEAFYGWHCERSGNKMPYATRHLTFMTYLNDVPETGGTEFFYQKLVIKPEKGLTLVWPADWTFTHRGLACPTHEKYIITGWTNYSREN